MGEGQPPQGPLQGQTPPAGPGTRAFRSLLDGLVALVPTEKQGVARGIAKELSAAFSSLERKRRQPNEGLGGLTVTHLQRVVIEAVQAAVGANQGTAQGTAQGRSWAIVASGGLGQSLQAQPTRAIPQRANRELLVRGVDLLVDFVKRSPAEIVQAINQALTKQGAITARKLPSGDVVVTFNDPTTKNWHSNSTQWIQQAFGEQAKEASRTYVVLVKGLRKADLQSTIEEAFGGQLGLRSVNKVKFRLLANPEFTRATVLVTLEDQEEARKVYNQGVIQEAQVLDYEPYQAILEPKQCFKYQKQGYIQRFYRREALCGRCGIGAYGEGGKAGEAICPTQQGQVPCRCPCCGGGYPAWARECPGKVKAKEEAREAYQYRPRTFKLAREAAIGPIAISGLAFTFERPLLQDEDGFQRVRAKRPQLGRGRPILILVAGRDRS